MREIVPQQDIEDRLSEIRVSPPSASSDEDEFPMRGGRANGLDY